MGRGTSLESSGTCGVPELVIELDELDLRSAKPCNIGGINAKGRQGFDAYVLMMYVPHLNEEPMLEPTESSKSQGFTVVCQGYNITAGCWEQLPPMLERWNMFDSEYDSTGKVS